MLNEQVLKILEAKITKIVKQVIRETEDMRNDDNVELSKSYLKNYKAVQSALTDPKVNATQVMSKALGFDPKDDAKRSHAFKQLHQEKTQDGSGVYKFSDSEINKLAGVLGL